MADIMNTNWDEPMDEVTLKQAVGAGVVGGLIAGGYKGVKDYRLEKLDAEEQDRKTQEILDRWEENRKKARAYKDAAKQKAREVKLAAYDKAKRKLDESADSREDKIIDDPTRAALKKLKSVKDSTQSSEDPETVAKRSAIAIQAAQPDDRHVAANLPNVTASNESAARTIGLGLGAYGAYKLTKAITAAGTKRALEDAEIARAEHERAFPKTEKKRKINKAELDEDDVVNESVIGDIKARLKGRKVAKQVSKINGSKLPNSSTICTQLNKKLASDITAVRKLLAAHIKDSEAPEADGFSLASRSKVTESCNYAVRPTMYGFGIEFVDWDLWTIYPDDARTRANNDDCAGFWKFYNELGTIIRDYFGGSGKVLGRNAVISDAGDWDGGSIELFISNADALRIVNGDEASGSYPRNESATVLSKVW